MSKKQPVTIIIPVHNSNGWIIKTVESIYKSTKYPFKIMIVESNSTDTTKQDCEELSKKYKEVEIHNINVDKGQKAINYGLKNSKGDVFVTHDDVIIPNFISFDWLEELVKYSKKQLPNDTGLSDVGIVCAANCKGMSGPEYINGFKWVGTWAAYIRRELINKIGGYDENMLIGDDIDYTYRTVKNGFSVLTFTDFFVIHHRSNEKPQDDGKKAEQNKRESEDYFKKKHGFNEKQNEYENVPVIIGVPVKNDLECLQNMLQSLIESTNFYSKIVIIDGDSDEKTKQFLNIIEKNPRIEVISTKGETSLDAYNRLFKIAINEGKNLLLTQTDVHFPKLYKGDWLQLFYNVQQNTNAGALMPLNGGGVSGPEYVNGFEWMGGWCSYYSNEVLKDVGGYDKNFPNGFGVDIDHSYKILQKGYNILKVNYWVDHHMMNKRQHDTNPQTEQMKQDSALHFRKKWKLGEFKEE